MSETVVLDGAGPKAWFCVFARVSPDRDGSQRCLQKFEVWGREVGGGGKLGSEPAASQPSQQWITGQLVLGLASSSVFAWLNCGVASQSSQVASGVWAGDPEASLAGRSAPRDTEIVQLSGPCLGCRIASKHPATGDCRLQDAEQGEGQEQRRLEEARSWLTRNGACKQYTTNKRDEASKAVANRERRLAVNLVYGANRLSMGEVGRSKGTSQD